MARYDRVPRHVADFVRALHAAVLRASGTPNSGWNGHIALDRETGASVRPVESLQLSQNLVSELDDLLTRQGTPTRQERLDGRRAVAEVTVALAEFTLPPGDPGISPPQGRPVERAGNEAISRSVCSAWVDRAFPQVADELARPGSLGPAVDSVVRSEPDPDRHREAGAQLARGFADRVAERAGVGGPDGTEVLRLMNNARPSAKADVVAGLMLRGAQDRGQLPSEALLRSRFPVGNPVHEAWAGRLQQLRTQIAAVVDAGFEDYPVDGSTPAAVAAARENGAELANIAGGVIEAEATVLRTRQPMDERSSAQQGPADILGAQPGPGTGPASSSDGRRAGRAGSHVRTTPRRRDNYRGTR